MNRKMHLSPFMQPLQDTCKKWYKPEVKTGVLFPVPGAIARERLQSAMASSTIFSKGFFYPTYKLTGKINGNHLELQFALESGKGMWHYQITGQLYDHPDGARLEMTMVDEIHPGNTVLMIFSLLFIMTYAVFNTWTAVETFPFIFVLGISFLLRPWYCRNAARQLSSLLMKMVISE